MIWYVNTHLFKTNFTSILRLHREIRMYVITVQQSLFNVLYAGLRIRIRWHQAIFSRVGSGLASTPPRSAILHWSIPLIYLLYKRKNVKGESNLGRIRVFFSRVGFGASFSWRPAPVQLHPDPQPVFSIKK